MNSLISDLLNAVELLSACKILKEMDAFLLENTAKRSAFCKSLSRAMLEQVGMLMHIYTFDGKPYAIYGTDFSMPLYLMANGLATGRVRDTRQNIRKLIDYIDREITAPSGSRLTSEQAEEALGVLTKKYPYFEIVGKRRPLTILNLDNTNRQYNSLCTIGGLGEDSIILMYHMKDAAISPVCVFLHELGHALHVALTGSMDVPEEFYEFQSMFSQKLMPQDPAAADVFADTFAIAVMHGGPLHGHMPFEVNNIMGDMIKRFFKTFFDKYANQAL